MSFNPYTQVSVTGYNSNPPSDDGAQNAANQITWSKHKTKIGDPLKAALEDINTNVYAAFAKRFLSSKTALSADYTPVSADYGKMLAVSGTRTITLTDSSTLGEGWHATVVNVGSGIVTLSGTINGQSFIELPNLNDSAVIMSDGSDFVAVINRTQDGPLGELASVASTTVPNGWLKADGATIGSTSSSATYKGEKYRALFNYLKASWGNAGTESFDANQTVLLPSLRGKVLTGEDASHPIGTSGGSLTQTPAGSISVSSNALSTAQLPSHSHTASTDNPGNHNHTVPNGGNQINNVRTDSSAVAVGTSTQNTQTDAGSHTHTVTVGSAGSGSTHTHTATLTGTSMSVEQPWAAGMWIIRY